MRKRSEAVLAAQEPANDAWRLPQGLHGLAIGGSELLAEDDAPDFVVDGLIEREDTVLLIGQEKKAQKTWLALTLAVARILGTEWLGRKVACGRPGRVLFISTETSRRAIKRRLRLLCAAIGIPIEQVAPYFYVIDRPVTLLPREHLERERERAWEANALAAVKIHDDSRRKSLDNAIDRFADDAKARLGTNVGALEALLGSQPGTWSLIVVDTVRQCLEGSENDSESAKRYTQGARDLARAQRCMLVSIHHDNKSGDPTDPRTSRGSTELTAGPEVLIKIDCSGPHPTAHFHLRNNERPEPVGFNIARRGEGIGLDVLPPCGRQREVDEDEVLEVLRAHAPDGLAMTTLRKKLQARKGGAAGSKANPNTVRAKLDALVARGLVSECQIVAKGGRKFEGWRFGSVGGVVEAKHLRTLDEALSDETDV